MKSWKAWLLVSVIFITGALVGAFGMRSYMARHLPEMLASTRQSMEERILEHIDREVSLTDAQKQSILPLIKEHVSKGEKLHASVRAQIDAVMAEMDDSIAEMLDPRQKVKFKEFRLRMEQFRRSGPPGPPSPGAFPPGPPPGGLPPAPRPGQ